MKRDKAQFDLTLFDVVSFLDDRGIQYSQAGSKNVSSGWLGVQCPFCSDRTNHLGINLSSGTISCFKCGTSGTVVKLIMEIDNCSFRFAVDTINKFVATDFSHLVRRERIHSDITKFPVNTSDNFLPIHDRFLQKRRYDRKFLQQKYDIMAVGPTLDDWKFRVIIPVYVNREIVTYIGRDTTGKLEVPYKNAPIERSIIQAKHCLYGIDEIKPGGDVIIAEGVLDKWRIGQGCVATFGTQVTTEQIRMLADKRISRAFILLDQDAHKQAERLAFDVAAVAKHVDVLYLDEGDPDSLTDDEAWKIRRDLLYA